MLDAVAAQGAVILPFSYAGASLGRSRGPDPTFSFNSYSNCDASPPFGAVCIGGRTIKHDETTLNNEITTIHQVWPNTHIVLLGHSQGGLVAFEWWLSFGRSAPAGSAAAAVQNVFTLDSPINGVCVSPVCLGPLGYPDYGNRDNPSNPNNDFALLAADAASGDPVRFLGTSGDTVPILPLVGGYGSAGSENLQHELLVTGSNCSDQANNADCPSPPDHVSGCPIDASSPSWVNDDQHFIVKFCPDDVAYFNNTLGLSY